MSEERKQLLEALIAKRKAGGENKDSKKLKSSGPFVNISPSKPGKEKTKVHSRSKLNPEPQDKPRQNLKNKVQKKPRVPESEESEEDVSSEAEFLDSSEDDKRKILSKKPSKVTGKSVKKPLSSEKSSKNVFNPKGNSVKGKVVDKGQFSKGKGKKKADNSDDDDDDAADVDDGDVSEDPLDEVDASNILPSRTRGRTSQPVRYEFGDVSDDDEDSDA